MSELDQNGNEYPVNWSFAIVVSISLALLVVAVMVGVAALTSGVNL